MYVTHKTESWLTIVIPSTVEKLMHENNKTLRKNYQIPPTA